MTMSKNKKSLSQKILLAVALTTGLFFIFAIYAILFPNTSIQDEDTYLYISDDDQVEDVLEQIKDKSLLINDFTFKVLAKQIKYDQKIRPGRYKITPGMSNFILLRKLRGGKQDPVKLVINNIRTKEQLAGRLSSMIMADSLSILQLSVRSLHDALHVRKVFLIPVRK